MAGFLDAIDWSQPWLAPYHEVGAAIGRAADWRGALNDAIAAAGTCNHRGLPVRFVPQSDLPAGMSYEAFISATGQVPTRDNLHDFFNALVWLTFPRIKVGLNALQAAEIERRGGAGPGERGFVRDAATIFDENAAIFVVRDAKWIDELRAHQWLDLLWERRATFHDACQIVLFGHALVEKLVTPYKAITAHTWCVLAGAEHFELGAADRLGSIDRTVAAQLQAGLQTSGFTPLPVLGIPGWADGQNASFYHDIAVFRPPRVRRA